MTDMDSPSPFALRARTYRQQHIAFWNAAARSAGGQAGGSSGYQRAIQAVYRARIPPGSRVLEIGCGAGDLLASLQPSYGLGVDFSWGWLHLARQRYPMPQNPNLRFLCADGLELPVSATFDFIILSDLVSDLWDVQGLLENLSRCCHPQTRLMLNSVDPFWASVSAPLAPTAQRRLPQNRLARSDLRGLLALAGFEELAAFDAALLPLVVPRLDDLCNQILAGFWPFRLLRLTQFITARPRSGTAAAVDPPPSVSVIIPARNEAGNIRQLIERIPRMGSATEVIFVEGSSSDDTAAEIERQIQAHPQLPCRLLHQQGRGKGDAVRLGFQHARGDVLVILDADLTVPPEYLPRFYQALLDGCGSLINGVRLVYPMEEQAMRLANYLGNKFFSLVFGWLIGQPVNDMLCGTKVLYRADYQKMAASGAGLDGLDPFGDFDLLFGAARLGQKIFDLPVRYQARTYSSTNIRRWKDGWQLMKMLVAAAVSLKFGER